MRAQASQSVVVYATAAAPEPLVGRLCAELASAGYAVSFQLSAPPAACQRGKGAQITLARDPVHPEGLIATICFEGTEVVVAGAEDHSTRFVISAAEALNGLRATAPLDARPRPRPAATPVRESPAPVRPHHSVSVGQSLVVDPGGFPPLWGAILEAELGLGAHAAIVLGGFFPIARAKTSTSSAELRTGVTFLRVGPALRYSLARFALEGSLVVGPAYTWVTAKAEPPYVGQTDAALGILGSAGLAIAYPDRSPAFVVAASRAGMLLPSPRVELPNEAGRNLGPLLIEASLSFGLRL